MVKVFYWDEVRRLAEHGDGYAIGIGETKEGVVDAIASDALLQIPYWSEDKSTDWADALRDELLSKEPKVFDTFPVGIAIPGSS